MTVSGYVTVDGERKAAVFELDIVTPDIPLRLPTALWTPRNNEWSLRAVPEHVDPVGIGFEGNGLSKGHVSGSDVRDDGAREMSTLLQFKRDERERDHPEIHSGEVTLHCRDGRKPGDGMGLSWQARHGELCTPKLVADWLVVNRVTFKGTEI